MDTRLSTTVISHEGYCGLYRCTCDTHGFRLLAPKVMYTHSIHTHAHLHRKRARAAYSGRDIAPLFDTARERERERESEGERERGNSFSMCKLCVRAIISSLALKGNDISL